jgi:hypothetical protein
VEVVVRIWSSGEVVAERRALLRLLALSTSSASCFLAAWSFGLPATRVDTCG